MAPNKKNVENTIIVRSATISKYTLKEIQKSGTSVLAIFFLLPYLESTN